MDRFIALNVFRQAAELGSFAAAARQLQMSAPAISKNISELETHLSTRLFNRTTRKMSLTEAGQFYYDYVVRVLDELEVADGTLNEMSQRPKGNLRVSAPMTVSLIALSDQLPQFLIQYPDLTLDLHLDDRHVDVVKEGFDVVLRGTDRLEDSSLIAKELLKMVHVLVGSPDYFQKAGRPQSPEELRTHSCVQFSLSGHADEWSFKKGGKTTVVPVNGRYKVTSSLAVRDALRSGFGLSLVPWMYVREDIASGQLMTVMDDYEANETTLYAVYPSRRFVLSKVRVFVEFLSEALEEIGIAQAQR